MNNSDRNDTLVELRGGAGLFELGFVFVFVRVFVFVFVRFFVYVSVCVFVIVIVNSDTQVGLGLRTGFLGQGRQATEGS